MNCDDFFTKVEKFKAPSTILFRSIELKFLKEKLAQISTNGTILDLGCGDGLTASLMFNKKIGYGLDNDKSFVKLARKRGTYKKVLYADARKIPLKDKSVNLVFSNCVIEHIKDLDSVLKEVSTILKNGGYFIFTTPSDNLKNYSVFSRLKLRWLARIYGKARDKKFAHYNCFSLKQWSRILQKKGFVVVDGYYYLDRKTAEFWDFLLIIFFLLRLVKQNLARWVYRKFFRQRVYDLFDKAQVNNPTGAAVCIISRRQ